MPSARRPCTPQTAPPPAAAWAPREGPVVPGPRRARPPSTRPAPASPGRPRPGTPPPCPPTRAADAEALRACHGRVVRREVFGLDAPALGATADERRLELTPYSVETHAYAATVLQASRDDRPGVVLATEAEKLALAYDRDLGDPRTEHTLNVVVDELGLVREAATVAYGRRTADPALPADVAAAQTATQVGYSVTEFTGDVVDAVHHRLRRPSRTSTYDLRGLARAGALFTLGDFAGVLSDAAVTQELLNRSDSLFYAADLTGPAPLHDLGDPRALPHERYELAFADDLLADVFGDKATDVVLTEGGYLRREGGWWVPSGRFELLAGGETPADARARFFCHIAHRDAWGARTTLAYLGDHHLLLAE